MPADTAGLRDRLEELDQRLDAWLTIVNGHFQALWSFTAAPREQFDESLRTAAITAEERAGPGPREEGYELISEVCDLYLHTADTTRTELRRMVKASRQLAALCQWFSSYAAKQLEATGGGEWLRRAVIAAALADTDPDYRDWYLTLGDVWLAAVRRGINPEAAFTAAAAASGAGRTRRMLPEFESSAYFAESVAPSLPRRRPGLE